MVLKNIMKGQKYQILDIDQTNKSLIIEGHLRLDLDNIKYQWGLAKDDVGPKDIFRLQKVQMTIELLLLNIV